jgi:hypothetical protein
MDSELAAACLFVFDAENQVFAKMQTAVLRLQPCQRPAVARSRTGESAGTGASSELKSTARVTTRADSESGKAESSGHHAGPEPVKCGKFWQEDYLLSTA